MKPAFKSKFFSQQPVFYNKDFLFPFNIYNPILVKKEMHFLRFNDELQFTFDSIYKTYSIQTGNVLYVMPYVLTLRLKRFLKANSAPSMHQMNEWFQNLPKTEKSLVTCTIMINKPSSF